MARIRTIKPEFFNSYDIASLSPLSRLFYAYLWTESDRDGFLEWKPNNFRMRFFPADNYDIADLCEEVINQGLVIIHDGNIAEIPGFTKHQVINNREAESILSPRVKVACARVIAEGRKEGKEGKEGKGMGVEDSTPKAKRFSPPSANEVAEYCKSRGNTVDPERFVDFYKSKGWKVGKEVMKDWQAAVRTWERGQNGGGNGKQTLGEGETIWS